MQVQGLFYGAPSHDVPALFAFFSILITTVNFVTSVEVRFYPAYRNYYSLFNDNGSIRDIEQAETEMLVILKQELTFGGHKQLLTTILFVVLGSYFLEWIPLGFTDTSIGIFRFLCAGYGVYAISNSIMLILLYFEDYTGALLGTMMFAAVSIIVTVLQILFGSVKYFGMGFLLGGIVFYFIVWLRLEWYTRRLPYFLLCKKSIVPNSERGIFAALCNYLDARDQRKAEQERKKMEEKETVFRCYDAAFAVSGVRMWDARSGGDCRRSGAEGAGGCGNSCRKGNVDGGRRCGQRKQIGLCSG